MSRRSLAALPVLLLACQVGDLYEYKDIRVDVFDNISERRTHEFDLTRAVLQEMAARGIRVNGKDAPYTLKGKVVDMRTPAVVDQAKTDVVLVGSLQLQVEVWLVDNRTGGTVWRDLRTETASFTSSRGENFQSARQEVFDRLARWVVTRFEKEW